uniref:FAD/NAD(P)-binding domain-containing protein n=1 Tax=Seriola lalandi dorsalis TaxID=1841481 RepID=A0A3B4WXW3_SERLL
QRRKVRVLLRTQQRSRTMTLVLVGQLVTEADLNMPQGNQNISDCRRQTPSSPYSLPPSPSSYPGYLSFPRHRVVEFRPDRKCVLESDSGRRTVVQVSKALVLIGAHPNLSFLDDNGRPLGINPSEPITCRRNPIEVDPFTNNVVAAEGPGLYAMGPLVGENFVRFLKGGALAIARGAFFPVGPQCGAGDGDARHPGQAGRGGRVPALRLPLLLGAGGRHLSR